MTDALQAILDRQAIVDLIYRYCRAVDRIDAKLGYSIYHDDAVVDYSVYKGTGHGSIDFICERHRAFEATSHQVTNIILELDGDRASSESYVTASLRMHLSGEIRQATIWARYLDRWSRRADRWGIDKRQTVIDFNEVRDITPMSQGAAGRNDGTDPSYALFS
jgi:ketosteroid isomerase-like protein